MPIPNKPTRRADSRPDTKTILQGPVLLGGVMVGFLALIVLITKGPISALEMLLAGALAIALAIWYDSL
jgi:hypothetical protein